MWLPFKKQWLLNKIKSRASKVLHWKEYFMIIDGSLKSQGEHLDCG